MSQTSNSWLSQANHIFSRLRDMSNFENYVLVHAIYFQLEIAETSEDPPLGFLFLCPEGDFQTGPSSFCWPDCPAYWSLDSSGVERLGTEEATRLGFPSIRLTAIIQGLYWAAGVYAGLRQFHEAKGFHAESQDIARHLAEPLYRLKNLSLFAHGVNGEDSDDYSDEVYTPEKPEYQQTPSSEDDEDSFIFDRDSDITASVSVDRESSASHLITGEEPAVAPTFKFLMKVQLMLILFLALSWLHGKM